MNLADARELKKKLERTSHNFAKLAAIWYRGYKPDLSHTFRPMLLDLVCQIKTIDDDVNVGIGPPGKRGSAVSRQAEGVLWDCWLIFINVIYDELDEEGCQALQLQAEHEDLEWLASHAEMAQDGDCRCPQ